MPSALIYFVFDLTDKASFKSIVKFMEYMERYLPGEHGLDRVLILIGNKADNFTGRKVSWDCAKELADIYNMFYVETSTITGQGIEHLFSIGAETILQRINEGLDSSKFKGMGISRQTA